jgi:Tol biopolymer transport system component
MDIQTGDTQSAFADDQKLAFDPRWSSDGAWLSYLAPDRNGVGAYHLQSETERFYPSTTGEPGIWEPQQNKLVISVVEALGDLDATHLILVDPALNTQVNLSGAERRVEDSSPAWSPDGRWLAFCRRELVGPGATLGKQIWRMRMDGSDAAPLTADAAFDFGNLQWSADGRYLLFHKLPLKGPDVSFSVWVLEVASGALREVASPAQRPQWLP